MSFDKVCACITNATIKIKNISITSKVCMCPSEVSLAPGNHWFDFYDHRCDCSGSIMQMESYE